MNAPALEADWFDGRSARAQRVLARIEAGQLRVTGDSLDIACPLADVRWPERTRHGQRVAHLRSGQALQALDPRAYDDWSHANGLRESWVVAAQQNWRATLIAVVLIALVAAGGYRYGVPWLARGVLLLVPERVDRMLGDAALRSLDASLLLPSRVPATRQDALRQAFAQAMKRRHPDGAGPPAELRFRTSRAQPVASAGASAPAASSASATAAAAGAAPAPPPTRLGPNAFALPGGTIVVTDELLALLDGRDDVLLGVLGHELGHVQRRHGMRMLTQAGLIGAAASVALGDFNSLLAAVPALLGQQAYSRDFEREADDDAVALLRANGIAPDVMVELFQRLGAYRAGLGEPGSRFDLGIALASHPADEERMRRFRAAAAR